MCILLMSQVLSGFWILQSNLFVLVFCPTNFTSIFKYILSFLWLGSSVGRAEDWKSLCRWFDSGPSHYRFYWTYDTSLLLITPYVYYPITTSLSRWNRNALGRLNSIDILKLNETDLVVISENIPSLKSPMAMFFCEILGSVYSLKRDSLVKELKILSITKRRIVKYMEELYMVLIRLVMGW